MFHAQLAELHAGFASSLPSAAYAFEPARSPRTLADSCVFCASAGLDTLGATSVTGPVGARGAGAIHSHCRRCARVARGRSSRLAPRCALASSPSRMAARGGRPRRSAAAGSDERRVRGRLWMLRLCGLCGLGGRRVVAGRYGGGIGGVGGVRCATIAARCAGLGVVMCQCVNSSSCL